MARITTEQAQAWLAQQRDGETYEDLRVRVAGHVNEHTFRRRMGDVKRGTVVALEVQAPQLHVIPVKVESSPPSLRTLEDLEAQGREAWEAYKIRLSRLSRPVRLSYLSDQHRPYHDPYAVELALKLTEDFNPDLIPSMNDWFDMPQFRKTSEGNAIFNARWPGGLMDAVERHGEWQREINDAAPNAEFPTILGNHEYWLWKFLEQHGRAVEQFTLAHFVGHLVDQGITWMGSTLDEVQLSPGFMMLHGKYATKNIFTTIVNTWALYGYQCSIIAGHAHRPGLLAHRGFAYNIYGAICACLCDLVAHYSRHRTNWTQGIVNASYDPNGHAVSLEPIAFHRAEGRVFAYWGGKEYSVRTEAVSVPLPQPAALAA